MEIVVSRSALHDPTTRSPCSTLCGLPTCSEFVFVARGYCADRASAGSNGSILLRSHQGRKCHTYPGNRSWAGCSALAFFRFDASFR